MTTTSDQASDDKVFLNRAVEAAIRIGLVVLLASLCFQIMRPFVIPAIWGIIIAVAVHPLYRRLQTALGERRGIAATVFTLLALALLITPAVMLSQSLVESTQALSKGLEEGTLAVPPPPEGVMTWPLIGEPLDRIWRLASVNLAAALEQVGPQLKTLGGWLLATAADAVATLLQFVIAIVIAGVLLANAKGGRDVAHAIAIRLTGEQGAEFADIAGATVRSVAQGVLGVALIQSLLAGIGLLAVEVPAAGLWALLVLLFAVVQLPPLLILGPIIIYVFSTADTVTAVVFMVWALFVSVSDTFLKPLLLGRGVEIPMLVILIGAIGGMFFTGIVGLFVGAVVLALGYKLFLAWLNQGPPVEEPSASEVSVVAKAAPETD